MMFSPLHPASRGETPRKPGVRAPSVRRRSGVRRRVLESRDKVSDALAAGSVRQRIENLQRRLHLTRTGQIAILAAIAPWVVARLIAGVALYVFAYGTALLV